MKKIKKTNFLVIAIIAFFATGIVSAQSNELTEKEQKRKEKKEALAENFDNIMTLINDSTFVIEVDYIRGRRTFTDFVDPMTNFIKIEGDEIVVQTGNVRAVGYNGLGGITVQGDVQRYQINKDEDDDGVNLLINFSATSFGFSTLNITISANGNVNARLNTGYGAWAQFNGEFAPVEGSGIYEGMSLF